jgi:photosystem II stability/assembly factor-like uncharacterized protein
MRRVASRFGIALVIGGIAAGLIGGATAAAPGGTRDRAISPDCGSVVPQPQSPGSLAATGVTFPAGHTWPQTASMMVPLADPLPSGRLVPWTDERAALFTDISYRTNVARTSDGGRTWTTFHELPNDPLARNEAEDFAAVGSQIDLARVTRSGAVTYRTSPDGALTWSDLVILGRANDPVVQVARSHDGTVAVAWPAQGIWVVRVSGNGGRTFGPLRVAGRPSPSSGCVDPGPGHMLLAVARNAIVIVFSRNDRLVARRSVDDGASWTHPFPLVPGFDMPYGIAASGNDVLVVYDSNGALSARHSHDGGRTWSAAARIAGPRLDELAVGRSGGDWSIAVARFGVLLYSQSADGVHWSALEPIATTDHGWFMPYATTTLNGKPTVAYILEPRLFISERP